jgi:hypothetical protein
MHGGCCQPRGKGVIVAQVDRKQLRKLLAEKLPQREIARQLKIPRSTLQRMIKAMDAPTASQASASDSDNGLPVVDTGKLTPVEADAVRADFWELIEWWRERKVQRAQDSTPRETARQTFHVGPNPTLILVANSQNPQFFRRGQPHKFRGFRAMLDNSPPVSTLVSPAANSHVAR